METAAVKRRTVELAGAAAELPDLDKSLNVPSLLTEDFLGIGRYIIRMATMTVQFMTWKDSWNVGVNEIDAQHKNLVSLLNQLHLAMSEGKGKDVLGTILDSLINYTKAHFAAEERLMQQSSYPELSAHKREHVQLTEKVLDFQRAFKAGGTVMTVEVMHFLSKWLQGHICGSDKKYVPFLHAHGVR